jgi:ketosteroid isomerase-like protein
MVLSQLPKGKVMNNNELIESHLDALKRADINQLMEHYADDAVLVFGAGIVEGKEAIEGMLKEFTTNIIPPDKTKWEIDTITVHKNIIYITWNTESDGFDIKHATDTFIVDNGKIVIQTSAGEIRPK